MECCLDSCLSIGTEIERERQINIPLKDFVYPREGRLTA